MRLGANRPTHRVSALVVAAILVAAVTFSGTGASAQNVESLRARAQRISQELDDLERRASELDEQYLQIEEQLQELESERGEQQRAVTEAEAAVERTRAEAAGYLVEAYIGAGSHDRRSLGSTDVNAAVNQRALLEIVRGDRQMLADEMDVSRQDLAARVAELERSERQLDERRAEQEDVAAQIESAVSEHRRLLDGANAELRAAIEAERQRREAEAAAAAQRQREEAAARAAEARREAERAAAQRSAPATTAQQPVASPPARGNNGSPGRAPAPRPSAPRPTAPRPTAPRAPAPRPPAPDSQLPVSAPNSRAAGAISAARSMLGTPYRWAGTSPSTGFDCSGLLVWSWSQVGVSLPRTSRGMYSGTQRISESQLQPGDLVFYGSPVYHVGMYVGGGQMVHSPRTGDVVKIAPIHRGFGNPSGYGRIA